MLNQETAKAARTDSGYILRAPRRMRVADAVAQYMRVPMGAGNSVPWDPLVAPYVIEPMNCLASREYDAVIFVGPARTGKPLYRPAQQRSLLPQRRHPKRTRKRRKPVQNPQKRQPHRPPVRQRHRHHLRLLQKMRRPDRRQQRRVAPRRHPRRRQRQLAVRRQQLRAKLLLNPLRPVRKLLLIVLKRLPVQLRWKTQALQLKVL